MRLRSVKHTLRSLQQHRFKRTHDSTLEHPTHPYKFLDPLHLPLRLLPYQLPSQPRQRLLQLELKHIFEVLATAGGADEMKACGEDAFVGEGVAWCGLVEGEDVDDAALEVREAALGGLTAV